MDEIPEPERVKMPFGKHKGEMLGDIPKSYLEWLQKNTNLKEPLATCVDRTVKMLGNEDG